MTTKKPKKRLVRGKDFDGWACIDTSTGKFNSLNVWTWRPKHKDVCGGATLAKPLKWVRVKFVPVEDE